MLFQYVLAALLVAQVCQAGNLRITDGQEAPPHQSPYLVSIVWGAPPLLKYRHFCGGSILNENWILTAGRCITELPPFGKIAVQAGKHIINKYEEGQQFSSVKLKVVHWKYEGGSGENDVAVLKLKTPLIFNEIVKPIRMPSPGKMHSGTTVFYGWGSVSKNVWPIFPSVLQTATVPIIDNAECFAAFHSVPGDREIFGTQLCTGHLHETISACLGDSGGPLVQYDAAAIPELVGIITRRVYPCGNGLPTVYTRVSSHIDWISHKIDSV